MTRSLPTDLPERLRDVEALDTGGGTVRLGSLWEERPVVLVFLRHFG